MCPRSLTSGKTNLEASPGTHLHSHQKQFRDNRNRGDGEKKIKENIRRSSLKGSQWNVRHCCCSGRVHRQERVTPKRGFRIFHGVTAALSILSENSAFRASLGTRRAGTGTICEIRVQDRCPKWIFTKQNIKDVLLEGSRTGLGIPWESELGSRAAPRLTQLLCPGSQGAALGQGWSWALLTVIRLILITKPLSKRPAKAHLPNLQTNSLTAGSITQPTLPVVKKV